MPAIAMIGIEATKASKISRPRVCPVRDHLIGRHLDLTSSYRPRAHWLHLPPAGGEYPLVWAPSRRHRRFGASLASARDQMLLAHQHLWTIRPASWILVASYPDASLHNAPDTETGQVRAGFLQHATIEGQSTDKSWSELGRTFPNDTSRGARAAMRPLSLTSPISQASSWRRARKTRLLAVPTAQPVASASAS